MQGKKVNSGNTLEFVEPIRGSDGREFAFISNSDIEENVCKWSKTLVGYVM